jgi:hypothetical protein
MAMAVLFLQPQSYQSAGMAFWLATVSPFLRFPLLPFAWPAGHKMEQELAALGIATAADLRVLPRPQLLQRFGERMGAFLHAACRGQVRHRRPGAGAGLAKAGWWAHYCRRL